MANGEVGDMIRTARERVGWNQEELARRVGIDRSIVSKWERGGHVPQVPDQVNALATALPISIEELLRAMGVNLVPAAASRLPRELVSLLLSLSPDQQAALVALIRPMLAKGLAPR